MGEDVDRHTAIKALRLSGEHRSLSKTMMKNWITEHRFQRSKTKIHHVNYREVREPNPSKQE